MSETLEKSETPQLVSGTCLTEEGLKLLVACVTEVFMVHGVWDFKKAAALLEEHGLKISPAWVEREWRSPIRKTLEASAERSRQQHLALMQDRWRLELIKAGIDLAQDRGGLREGGARTVKDLAVAVSKLSPVQAKESTPPQIPPITLQRFEIITGPAQPQPAPLLEAEKPEKRPKEVKT